MSLSCRLGGSCCGGSSAVGDGSGGGGGLIWLNSELKKDIPDLKIVLTDFYPNIPAFQYTKENLSIFLNLNLGQYS